MSKFIIVDSGSTKAVWALIEKWSTVHVHQTTGINPSTHETFSWLMDEKFPQNFFADIAGIYFYGSGVKGTETESTIRKLLGNLVHDQTKIFIENDLLAAARATASHETGIISIIGTGSNCGYYNGNKLIQNRPSLGFILSDEGSGSHMGKEIAKAYYYGSLPKTIKQQIEENYDMQMEHFLEKVYKSQHAAAYLASFTRFLNPTQDPWSVELIENSFQEFIDKKIKKQNFCYETKCHFVGSIAYHFKEILIELLNKNQLNSGLIVQTPLNGLIKYHQSFNPIN